MYATFSPSPGEARRPSRFVLQDCQRPPCIGIQKHAFTLGSFSTRSCSQRAPVGSPLSFSIDVALRRGQEYTAAVLVVMNAPPPSPFPPPMLVEIKVSPKRGTREALCVVEHRTNLSEGSSERGVVRGDSARPHFNRTSPSKLEKKYNRHGPFLALA